MDPSEFRDVGHRVVDLLSDYFEHIEEKLVFPDVEPKFLASLFDEPLPETSSLAEQLLAEVQEKLLPYCTHVGHPGYMGLITPSPNPIGVLADFICSALNQNIGTYSIGPAGVAIERRTIRWLTDLVGYGQEAGGNLTSGGMMAQVRTAAFSRRRYALAQEEVAGLNARIEEMDEMIRRQEAFIAQSELLDFLRSKRYTFNPLNIANAIAGLPYIGWRQSMTRCQKHKAVHPDGFQMQMFQRVVVALANPPLNADRAIEQMKVHLLKIKPRRDSSVTQLRKDFYYLRVATEAAYESRPLKSALPYRVFSEFIQLTNGPRSQFDLVMEEEERL